MTAWPGVIEAFRDRLPVTEKTPVVTLLEGNTPLIKSSALSQETGAEVYLKVEGANPTGSFKDRGMTLAVSKALEAGSNAVICASTGNTSSSAAAYAARAGIKCAVLIPEGMVAAGKLAQGAAHGATVIEIEGNFDQAIEVAKIIGEKYPVTLVNSLNPHRIQGQKTAAFEICDTLHRSPDFHLIPVGNAGNITAYHIGYSEYAADGRVQGLPKMFGFQAAGAAPIVTGKIVEDPQTIASAIRIGNPASWDTALKAADETGGAIKAVTDEEIVESYKRLASRDGVFVEPASAASVAGLMKLSDENVIAAGATVVCTLTGHGLKDPDRAIATADKPQRCRPEVSEVVQALGF